MIDSTQITNTQIFAIIAVLVFNLLSRNLRKFNKKANFKLYIIGTRNFQGTFEKRKRSFISGF